MDVTGFLFRPYDVVVLLYQAKLFREIGLFIGLSFSLRFNFGYTFANLKLAAMTLTPSFQYFLSDHFRTSSLVVLLHTASVTLLKNEPNTKMSQRHLPMKTRQTNSEAKHQTTYSIRSRICKSTPGRISFELFRWCSGYQENALNLVFKQQIT